MNELTDERKQELRALTQAAAYMGQSASFMANLPEDEGAYVEQWLSDITNAFSEAFARLQPAIEQLMEIMRQTVEAISNLVDIFIEAAQSAYRKVSRWARWNIYGKGPSRVMRWRGVQSRLTLPYPLVRWYPLRM